MHHLVHCTQISSPSPQPSQTPSPTLPGNVIFATDVTKLWSVCMSSVTFVHPAKAGGQNEMPFDRNTCTGQVTLY